jgi:hypothetical protein
MTSCDKCQAGVVALFDNEADDKSLCSVSGHLRDCAECRVFCLELIGIRRTLASASIPSLSPTARQEVLEDIKTDQRDRKEAYPRAAERSLSIGRLERWAAVLAIGVLSVTCLTLNRAARDLRNKLGAAEQQVAAMHAQAERAESEERQQKAISALYFRMAELEERVDRFSPSQQASFPTHVYGRPERQDDL